MISEEELKRLENTLDNKLSCHPLEIAGVKLKDVASTIRKLQEKLELRTGQYKNSMQIITNLKAENERLVEELDEVKGHDYFKWSVLKFYADEENWKPQMYAYDDKGKKAREALNAK